MNTLWILAAASPNAPETAPSVLKAEPVTGQNTTTALTSAPNSPGQAVKTAEKPGSPYGSFALIGLMFVVMYFLMIRGPRKKQQQQKQMIQALKKNDRIQTIGGILGTIIDVKDDEVLVKVDENNNTKIWFATGAISRVLSDEKK